MGFDAENFNKITKEEEDAMSATAQNYVYEMKTSKNKPLKEQTVSKELLDLCKKVAEKYPLKK